MRDLETASSSVRSLWAKSNPRHPLWKHLLDASAVSLALPLSTNVGFNAEITALLVGLHDIGKADPAFQHRIPDFSRELVNAGFPITGDIPCRHERLSAQFVREVLRDSMSEYDTETIGRVIITHHGYWDESPRPVPAAYRNAQQKLFQLLKVVLHVDHLPVSVPGDHSAFGMWLAGRIVLCDWITSNEQFVGDSRLRMIDDPEQYFVLACSVTRTRTDALTPECNRSTVGTSIQ